MACARALLALLAVGASAAGDRRDSYAVTRDVGLVWSNASRETSSPAETRSSATDASRDVAKTVETPIFLKLHKVGSTTAASFFECAHARLGYPERCALKGNLMSRTRDEPLWNAWPPWKHGTHVVYAKHGAWPFRAAGCGRLFVVLRDPVDRIFSLVGYFFRKPMVKDGALLKRAQALLREPAASSPSQLEAVLDAYDKVWHGKPGTTWGIGLREYEDTFGPGPPAEALAPFIVGLTDAMDQSLALFAAVLGWPPEAACLIPAAHTRKAQRARAYPAWVRRTVERRVPRDVEIFAAAVALHQR